VRAIYISHNELASPLVRSQVLPYLDALAPQVAFDLVTFERGAASPPPPVHAWRPVVSTRGSSLRAKALDMARGVWVVARIAIGRRAQLIHARSYVPATIAMIAGAMTRVPYIFDMRGFLGDEFVDAGYWSRDDIRYRAISFAERFLLGRAGAVVVLTEAAARRLRTERRFRAANGKPVVVIPCGVDLERFRPAEIPPAVPTLVYSGSLGSFYRLDEMLLVYAAARRRIPALRFLILNRSDHALIERARDRLRIEGDVCVVSSSFDDMPARLRECSVGIALVEQKPSKSGSSAIKVAEYLAAGLPVIVNAGLGDTDGLVDQFAAGHVIPSYIPAELERAGARVAALIGDPAASRNARRLAEAAYDVRDGAERYRALYDSLTRNGAR
jgi:glycosyltransferase involved in cell wall biosynthesis